MNLFRLIRIAAMISAAAALLPSFAEDASSKANSKNHELVAAYSIAEPGTEVTAALRNNLLGRELVIQTAFRSATGTETQGQDITLRAREARQLPLSVLFNGITDDSGQVVFRFNSANAQNVAASLVFRRGNKEVQPRLPAVDVSSRSHSTELRILWHRPNATATVYLVLANAGQDAATVSVGTREVQIAPLTTLRVPLDAGDRAGDMSNAVRLIAPATISVTAVASGGAAASTFTRRSAAINKPAAKKQPETPPLVTLRSAPLAPGACSPERGYSVLLHNLSDVPITSRASLKEYRGGVAVPIDLVPVKIGPGETVMADFPGKRATASAWHAVDIEYAGDVSDLAGMVLAHTNSGVETQPLFASAGKSYVGTQWLSAPEVSTAVRVVSVGRKPAGYSVTFFAPDSSVVYQFKEAKLKPGEDALVDVAHLREQAIPDPQGRRMPLATEEGTFEVETLDTSDDALLFAAAMDASAAGTPIAGPLSYCCGSVNPDIQPNPVDVIWQEWALADAMVENTCTGQRRKTGASWWTDDTMIASVDSLGNVYGFAPGGTNVDAEVWLRLGGPFGCGDAWQETIYAPVCVASLAFSGDLNNFAFVGTDSHLASANSVFLSAAPQPSLGTFGANSGVQGDNFTFSFRADLQLEKATYQTTTQSTANLDRIITYEFTPPGACGTRVLVNRITARKFAYATNNDPSNVCTLGFGTDRTYTYTVYTHPDRTALPGDSLLTGTPVTETFDPEVQCGVITGDGTLRDSGQFIDHVSSICSTAPLTCLQTTTQTLSVAGYAVRTNTLSSTTTGITYTSNGPTE